MWKCHNCSTQVLDDWEVCWACGELREGGRIEESQPERSNGSEAIPEVNWLLLAAAAKKPESHSVPRLQFSLRVMLLGFFAAAIVLGLVVTEMHPIGSIPVDATRFRHEPGVGISFGSIPIARLYLYEQRGRRYVALVPEASPEPGQNVDAFWLADGKWHRMIIADEMGVTGKRCPLSDRLHSQDWPITLILIARHPQEVRIDRYVIRRDGVTREPPHESYTADNPRVRGRPEEIARRFLQSPGGG